MGKKDTAVSEPTEVSVEQPATDSKEEAEVVPEEATVEEGKAEVETKPEAESEPFTDLNPDELPPELQATYKQLQADYTRKTQEAATLKRDAEEYRRLQEQKLLESKFPEPAREATAETKDYLMEAIGLDATTVSPEERTQLEQLGKIVDAVVAKQLTAQIKPMQNHLLTKEYDQELKEVRKEFSDFDHHLADIESIVKRHPQMSYREAYKLATWEKQEQKGVERAYQNIGKKKAQVMPQSEGQATEDKSYGSFEEAAKDIWGKLTKQTI